jgi:hypothetical protein
MPKISEQQQEELLQKKVALTLMGIEVDCGSKLMNECLYVEFYEQGKSYKKQYSEFIPNDEGVLS